MSTITLNPKAKPANPKPKPSLNNLDSFVESTFWKAIRPVLPHDRRTTVGFKLLEIWNSPNVEWIDREADNLRDAFTWSSTPQGGMYWLDLHKHLKDIDDDYAERCS